MTWLYVAVGIPIGLVLGWLMHAYVSRAIEAENEKLRAGLRAIRWGHAGAGISLLRYIDRLLGDEAA